MQLPSGLANGGLLASALQSASGNSNAFSSSVNAAAGIVRTVVGMAVGLFTSAARRSKLVVTFRLAVLQASLTAAALNLSRQPPLASWGAAGSEPSHFLEPPVIRCRVPQHKILSSVA